MQMPWDNDPVVSQPSPFGSRPVVREGPPTATPQTPEQRRKTQLETTKIERELSAPVLTEGQKAVDTEFAKDYAAYTAGGGFADVRKQLDQLAGVTKKLKSGQNLTGPVIGRVPDLIGAWTNPDAIATREAVGEVVQRSLRQVLGAQFTEKEGERLIARAYNPALPEVENRKRVARLRIQLTQAAKAKDNAVRYFEKHGTLKGWKGRLPSLGDFDPERNPQQMPRQKAQGIQFLGFEE